MKKLLLLLIIFLAGGTLSYSLPKEDKEHQEDVKRTRKQLDEKSSKAAKKEAKQLVKEGWKAAPGALPLEKQLDKSYLMALEEDDDYMPKYMFGDAMSVSTNYDAAKMQAIELAKQQVAGILQTEITTLVENTVSNEQLGPGEAEAITSTVSASKNLIVQSLGRTITVVELFRELKNGNKEVRIRIAYNSEMAKKAAQKAVLKNLKEKGEDLHLQLDKLMGAE